MESTYNEILYTIDMKITDARNKFIGVLLLDKKIHCVMINLKQIKYYVINNKL